MKLSFLQRQLFFFINRYFIIIVICVFVAILGVGYLFFIKNTVTQIQEIGVVDLQVREQELAAKQETLGRLQRLNEKYTSLTQADLAKLGDVLPSQSEIPSLVIEIKNFVESSGLVLRDIDAGVLQALPVPSATTPAGLVVKKLPITLSVSGIDSYSQLKSFLDTLSTNLPLLELTSLSYSPAADSYNLNVTSYYR